ncbi:hypothetical protein ASPACDRAFT_110862 [Aspergillus aculeatus ATCC 16872]|uniref:Serine-threonine protein kinase 19 n=1 Tax=Aspergillus aculeatus (strain ATCC 16872 / CBS 172.66 / WB 5094) TaxID=690307 RepID=A0A1L9XAA8_ASPA1|nr:uncharacterized protein ASPACDRAFT_110862 [Aspergillus aculeatus ATCC 16872]OJK05362.1 hypothetical protein ASPACDRAFT_110862 [Aspergillus aculeatus ATCC 16872]
MPLRITSAPVAGIKKNRKSNSVRPRVSPFAAHPRRKATASSTDAPNPNFTDDYDQGFLPDMGLSRYVSETAPATDVMQAIHSIRTTMFEDLPQRAGMSSTRIAEVLNLRRSIPPLASVAHVHTLLDAPTGVEKEIMELISTGRVRRLIVPGRGSDAAGLGDCLVLAEEWDQLVQDNPTLEESLKEKFRRVLSRIGNNPAVPGSAFTVPEYMALIRAGFLVSSSSLTQGASGFTSLPALPASSAVAAAASRKSPHDAASDNAVTEHNTFFQTATLFLSLPNTGPYLRLLSASRSHLLSLLNRSGAREVPLYLLRDRWDGAVENGQSFSIAKRIRGEFAGILPGRTKKWKELYGMSFRWALEEALGAGLIELFDTGSVGPGVRSL